MAIMLRAVGVPARVAIGFTQGTSKPDGSYLISSNDAHAWVEVLLRQRRLGAVRPDAARRRPGRPAGLHRGPARPRRPPTVTASAPVREQAPRRARRSGRQQRPHSRHLGGRHRRRRPRMTDPIVPGWLWWTLGRPCLVAAAAAGPTVVRRRRTRHGWRWPTPAARRGAPRPGGRSRTWPSTTASASIPPNRPGRRRTGWPRPRTCPTAAGAATLARRVGGRPAELGWYGRVGEPPDGTGGSGADRPATARRLALSRRLGRRARGRPTRRRIGGSVPTTATAGARSRRSLAVRRPRGRWPPNCSTRAAVTAGPAGPAVGPALLVAGLS